MTKARTIERRYTTGAVEVRRIGSTVTIEGHAAVFERLSQNLGGFVEKVAVGAFTKTIQEADVRALQNHDANLVLGRNTSGTLDLSEDTSGLYYRIKPPPTTYADDLLAVMERGDVNQSSFAFRVIDDSWGFTAQDFPVRTLNQVQLVDVSVVTYPAYLDANSGLGGREAALAGLALRSGIALADLGDVEAIKRALQTPEDTVPEQPFTPERWVKRAETLALLSTLD